MRDVAAVIERAVVDPALRHQTIEVGGLENLTRNDVAALYGRVAGRAPRVRHVPAGVVAVLASLLGPVHPGVARIMRTAVADETLDQTFDPGPLLRRLPMALTRLEDVARERMEARPGT